MEREIYTEISGTRYMEQRRSPTPRRPAKGQHGERWRDATSGQGVWRGCHGCTNGCVSAEELACKKSEVQGARCMVYAFAMLTLCYPSPQHHPPNPPPQHTPLTSTHARRSPAPVAPPRTLPAPVSLARNPPLKALPHPVTSLTTVRG